MNIRKFLLSFNTVNVYLLISIAFLFCLIVYFYVINPVAD
ncbi:hypothetical protein [Acinetobacter stercoris]|uniref:Uncharacterized protein n=1 Tax=Acinetobacter stercoris TaxID=2126983 RepID=A0A2U3MWV1_9GAMM|nr:hypothetical protein KPC_1096 [Acinetobacter stercoris]